MYGMGEYTKLHAIRVNKLLSSLFGYSKNGKYYEIILSGQVANDRESLGKRRGQLRCPPLIFDAGSTVKTC